MASIQCPGCKAHIAVRNLSACPRCSTPLPKPAPQRGGAALHTPAPAPGASLGLKEWFGLAVLGAIVILVCLIGYRLVVPSESQVHDRKVSVALLACQQRIAGLAEFGGAEMPPYSKNWARGDEFSFSWPRGSFHFKNGFGASVPMSASCTGVVSTGEIQHLTLNSKDVIANTP